VTKRPEQATGLNEIIGANRARITEMKEVSRLSEVEFEAHRVVHPLTRNKATLAQFNELVQQLSARRAGSNFVVGVTGVVRGAGASYVAMNVAAALAAEHRRTALLVQCNPYPTALNRLLVPYPDIGLTDYLAYERMHIDDIVYAPGVARMRVIPYGNEMLDARLLASARMEELVRTARARYSDRFIVLDLPEAPALESVQPLLGWLDGTVLVVPYGSARTRAVRQAVDRIGAERLAGLIMNRVPG
jgi:Mrp family chromosome partitioning ATPase